MRVHGSVSSLDTDSSLQVVAVGGFYYERKRAEAALEMIRVEEENKVFRDVKHVKSNTD